jgi:hypothetical protein
MERIRSNYKIELRSVGLNAFTPIIYFLVFFFSMSRAVYARIDKTLTENGLAWW